MRCIVEPRGPVACAGAWRHLRAAAVSLVALGLAVAGHQYGGGAVPSAASFLAVWTLAAAVSWRLTRQQLTVRTLAGTLVLVQAAMHVLCSMQSGDIQAGGTQGGAMLAGHAVATVLSVAVLRYGEATAWALSDALLLRPVELSVSLECSPIPTVALASDHAWHDARAITARLLVRTDPGRAPPAVA